MRVLLLCAGRPSPRQFVILAASSASSASVSATASDSTTASVGTLCKASASSLSGSTKILSSPRSGPTVDRDSVRDTEGDDRNDAVKDRTDSSLCFGIKCWHICVYRTEPSQYFKTNTADFTLFLFSRGWLLSYKVVH
jgi:hypothetical protein